MIAHFSYFVTPTKHTFISFTFEFSVVTCRSIATQGAGIQQPDQHIVVFLHIEVYATTQTAVQYCKIKTDVIIFDSFPSSIGCHQFFSRSNI